MIFDTLLAKLAPFECLGCVREGCLLCESCSQSLQRSAARCYRCRRISPGYKTCDTCRRSSDVYSVTPYAVYDGLAKSLTWQLKFNGAQAASREMAALLAPQLAPSESLILVPVPTATSRMRKRGYDQAVILAQALAAETRLPFLNCLRRLGQDEQLGATRQQRITQLHQAYRCVRPGIIKGQHIVLVDDVVTTGATLESAARTLKAAGAGRVSALVFAQA